MSACPTDNRHKPRICPGSRFPSNNSWSFVGLKLEQTKSRKFVIQKFIWITKFKSRLRTSPQAKMTQDEQMRACAFENFAYHSEKLVSLDNSNKHEVDCNTFFEVVKPSTHLDYCPVRTLPWLLFYLKIVPSYKNIERGQRQNPLLNLRWRLSYIPSSIPAAQRGQNQNSLICKNEKCHVTFMDVMFTVTGVCKLQAVKNSSFRQKTKHTNGKRTFTRQVRMSYLCVISTNRSSGLVGNFWERTDKTRQTVGELRKCNFQRRYRLKRPVEEEGSLILHCFDRVRNRMIHWSRARCSFHRRLQQAAHTQLIRHRRSSVIFSDIFSDLSHILLLHTTTLGNVSRAAHGGVDLLQRRKSHRQLATVRRVLCERVSLEVDRHEALLAAQLSLDVWPVGYLVVVALSGRNKIKSYRLYFHVNAWTKMYTNH